MTRLASKPLADASKPYWQCTWMVPKMPGRGGKTCHVMPSITWPSNTHNATAGDQSAILPATTPTPRLMHSLKLYERVDAAIGKVQSDHEDLRHPGRIRTAFGQQMQCKPF